MINPTVQITFLLFHIFLPILWITTDRGRSYKSMFITWTNMYAATIVSFQMFGFIQITTLPYLSFPITNNRVVSLEILGILIALVGVLFASWAKIVMGTSWGRPAQHDKTIQSRLVTRGPFARSRNPIYVGLFLLFVGQQIALQSYALLGAFIYAIAIYKAVKTEETLLTKYFGIEYITYTKRVPKFL